MALVRCPECGRDNVSDSAAACPDCGYAIKEHFDKIREEEKRLADEKAAEEKRKANEEEQKQLEQKKRKWIIDDLESKIQSNKKEKKISLILLIVFVIMLVVCWHYSDDGSLGTLIVMFAFASVGALACLISSSNNINKYEADLDLAHRDMEKYEAEIKERERVAAIQARQQAKIEAAQHPVCPVCGSKKTERISTMNRAASVAAVGLASGKIGKQYKCKNCKHMW